MRSLRTALLCAVALSVVGAAEAAAQDTGFEARDGATWTTNEEEQDYLRELDADQRRLRVQRIGVTSRGLPLDLVQVDVNRPRPLERVAEVGHTPGFTTGASPE